MIDPPAQRRLNEGSGGLKPPFNGAAIKTLLKPEGSSQSRAAKRQRLIPFLCCC